MKIPLALDCQRRLSPELEARNNLNNIINRETLVTLNFY